MITRHIDKNNLHHAYLIEGAREEIVAEILEFIKDLGIESVGNADVSHIAVDSFKIDDARNLKSYSGEKGYTASKKIFIISANNFLLEAQNSMLKMFEEPIENTHFFIIVPDTNALLKTFLSRFYVIKPKQLQGEESSELAAAQKFITLPLSKRIDFIKELITETDDEEGEEIVINSTRSKALKFLNAVETVLHKQEINKIEKNSAALTLPGVPSGTYAAQNFSLSYFKHIFKVREFLRMPGSSTKSLMESVALVIPKF